MQGEEKTSEFIKEMSALEGKLTDKQKSKLISFVESLMKRKSSLTQECAS